MNLESAGARLKKIRQEKGISLEEVQKKTKVHLNILKAIEGDGLTNLSSIYLKGFIKIYCKFLKVDPKEYIPDYKEALSAPLHAEESLPEDKPLKPPSFLENATLRLGSFRPDKKLKNIIITVLIIIIFSFLLFKLGKFISSKVGNVRLPRQAQVMQQRSQIRPQVIKAQANVSKAQVPGERLPMESGGGISLVISAKENCLVFVKADGKVLLHRVLERGRSDSWKAKEKIELSLSNAAAVELIVNGQRFSNLGRNGQQLKNIVITEKEGLKIPR